MKVEDLKKIETMQVYGMTFTRIDPNTSSSVTDLSHKMKSDIGEIVAHVGLVQIIMEFKNGNMTLGPRVSASFRYESDVTEDTIRAEIRTYIERLMVVLETDIMDLDVKRSVLVDSLDELKKGENFGRISK